MPTRVVTTSSTLPEPQHAATTLITDPLNDDTTTTTDPSVQGTPGYGRSAGYGPTAGYTPDTPNSGLGGSINYNSEGTPSPGPSFGYNGVEPQHPGNFMFCMHAFYRFLFILLLNDQYFFVLHFGLLVVYDMMV